MSNEFKGTKGPWRIGDDGVTFKHVASDTYHQICAGNGFLDDHGKGFCISGRLSIHDAILISSAPELLDALQHVVIAIDGGTQMDVVNAVDYSRKAINKALGVK